MKSSINKSRLNGMLRGIQKSIDLFQGQGYEDVYFTAQFIRGSKKQNCIERGDISKFITQVRAYVDSEQADTVRLEFFDDTTGKSIYAKALSGLRDADAKEDSGKGAGLGGFAGPNGSGLGEVEFNRLVDQRVEVKEKDKDFIRLTKENEELRTKNETLTTEKEELAAEIQAKSDVERYLGIIGTIFPGLATVFQGTRLANFATTLAGTTDMSGKALPKPGEGADEETQSISSMVSEFCETLNAQEAGIIHMLFMAFEKDRNQMKRAFEFISQTPATT